METINKDDWKITDNRFVAFIDILGFTDSIMRKTHQEIYETLEGISEIKESMSYYANKYKKNDGEVHIVTFSDSIGIFSKNDNIESYNNFIVITTSLFSDAIDKGVPLKGAIAHGKISLNREKQIYFGQPIIDAYKMEGDVSYMGITAHNSIDNYISKLKDIENQCSHLLFESKTSLKSGSFTHINLDWFIMNIANKAHKERIENKQYTEDYDDVITKIKSFRKTASGSARKYIDNTLKILELKNKKGKKNKYE